MSRAHFILIIKICDAYLHTFGQVGCCWAVAEANRANCPILLNSTGAGRTSNTTTFGFDSALQPAILAISSHPQCFLGDGWVGSLTLLEFKYVRGEGAEGYG